MTSKILRIAVAMTAVTGLLAGGVAGEAVAKKKKKKPKPAACAPFTPGEAGVEQPTVMLKDSATEAEPVAQTVTLDESVADLTFGRTEATYSYFNIQVDTANPDAGLWILLEFPTRRDYDLNLLHTDGSYAARARSFNTVLPAPLISTPGHGGEGTDHSEKLLGIRTADCGGWTLSVENHLGEGGDFDVQLWLGEAMTDPQAPGEETP